ncbi:MAG: putative amidohydrolase YtcJ [Parasphingorhabdus sp.]|jgi:predicted amidohydrolase YtcJ
MHAVGDRAVRAGLDAIEVARNTNGFSGLRHEIAHTAFVHPQDLERFAKLNTVAEVSPKLWYPNAITSGQIKVLGEDRTHRCHPIASLLSAGALVTYGSDWPAAAPDANPWPGIAGMLSRQDPLQRYPGTVGADEAINLASALPLFTTNGAKCMGLEDHIGSLQVGKSADFVQLEKSIFDMSSQEIGAIQVSATIFEGQVVFGEKILG